MKIVVTGASGILGSEAVKHFADHEVLALGHAELDLLRPEEGLSKIAEFRPEVVIHAAAWTDLEKSETDPDRAFRINALGAQQVALAACRDGRPTFVYISSTGVYGSARETEGYTEADAPEPTTVHHKTKWQGERFVREITGKHLVLRTGWLFGGVPGMKKNFVYNRIQEAKGSGQILSDNSQMGNPTFVGTLLRQIDRLLVAKAFGTFNAVNHGCARRLEYVREIVAESGVNCRVEAAPPGHFKRVAPVSKNECAVNAALGAQGLDVFGDWREDLRNYVRALT